MKEKIDVLVVDDSAVVRQTLGEILTSDGKIEVRTAADPLIAADKLRRKKPDVIVLDVEMPRMDGLTFLKTVMSQHPIPVVMCSALTGSGSETAMRALEYGAIEIITKPKLGTKQFLEESKIIICDAVKAASIAKPKPIPANKSRIVPKLSADAILPKSKTKAMLKTTERVVVIGASTGGTEALRIVLEEMPLDAPGIVIVQHMPEHFTTSFANRLDTLCRISVKEAADNDTIIRGRALIAPGNRHAMLKRSGARYYVEVKDGPLVNRHRPSADVLFRSAARYAGKNAVGVIMTGMGDDGAKAMVEMKEAGAINIAQDEATSVVFGMPHEAIKLKAVDHVLPLYAISNKVIKLCE